MMGKKTKGRQKIDIRKIEKDEDRIVTFSKRKNGIYTKICELSILCGVKIGFLVYSGTEKAYTFGNPSIETVAQRFLNGEGSSSCSSSSTMDAYRKVKLEELCKEYNSLVEKSEEAEAIEMAREAAEEATLPVEEDAWWKFDPEEVKGDEDTKQLLKKYEEFYAKLYEAAERKKNGGDVASSSHHNLELNLKL